MISPSVDVNDNVSLSGYTLMNKNTPLIDFDFIEDISGFKVSVIKVYSRPWFLSDLLTWLRKRHAPKHRENITKLFSELGLTDVKSMVDFSKGLSLTDTLWVNHNDRYRWEDVNLFDNPFDEVIARIAFDGGMHGKAFSTTSPEITTDGAFAKCWVGRETGIYLLKQGTSGVSNAGLEPYSEQYCSEILDALRYTHVQYSTEVFRGKLVSSCKLLTDKSTMMLPMSMCLEEYEFRDIESYCKEHSMEKDLYKMLIFDYLVTNDDRHLNNVGVLLDADTFVIKGLAPIYDNGGGLLPYAVQDVLSSYATTCKYTQGKGPRFYEHFFPVAKYSLGQGVPTQPIRKLFGFSFRRDYEHSLPEWRLQALEEYVRQQARHLLSGEDPYSKLTTRG
jgi:hypothetical protein